MFCYWINPLSDPRWPELVDRHPRATVFHTRGWLDALQRTYGYEPVVLTTAAPGRPLTNGMVFCRITSWLTGRRLVSLPFSDHCDALLDHPYELELLMHALRRDQQLKQWKYVEFRPCDVLPRVGNGFAPSGQYYLHRLDLRPEVEDLFRSFHKNHIMRKIRRAERENLHYEEGRSEGLLRSFYQLFVQTRRRHGLRRGA